MKMFRQKNFGWKEGKKNYTEKRDNRHSHFYFLKCFNRIKVPKKRIV